MMERRDVAEKATSDESAVMTLAVHNARPIDSKTLFALVDVELEIAGVALLICGVQARRLARGGTAVHLPTYRGTDGAWHAAIRLPPDLHAPLAEAVLAFLVEEGLAKPRYTVGSD